MKWIKTRKDLPEKAGYYLVAVGEKPDVIWWNDDLKMWVGLYGFELTHIKYWAEIEPVPEDVGKE